MFWSNNCARYLKNAIKNVNNLLGVDKYALKNYGDGYRPFSYSYIPELNTTDELGKELTNIFQ